MTFKGVATKAFGEGVISGDTGNILDSSRHVSLTPSKGNAPETRSFRDLEPMYRDRLIR